MRNETRDESIRLKYTLLKSPDVFRLDYCALGLLKRALFKRNLKTSDGFWKIVKEECTKLILMF